MFTRAGSVSGGRNSPSIVGYCRRVFKTSTVDQADVVVPIRL
jgi:hypothetical protein